MKILHVITGLQKAAGTSVFCGELCNRLINQEHQVSLAIPNKYIDDKYPIDSKIKVIQIDNIIKYNEKYDIIHIHGLWSPLLHKIANWAQKNRIPIVWSTHGMTAPWSMRHKRWKKIIAWLFYQKKDLKNATSIHCTTVQEELWNNHLGFKNCFVVPLGTNEKPGVESLSFKKYLLFVGRIYPVKGLEYLIRAWRIAFDELESENKVDYTKNWNLKLVGPDQAGYKEKLEELVQKLGIGGNIEFLGAKYGDELSIEYDQCKCLVLPSFTENFGGVVIDAMAHNKPCITSIFTPWKELQDNNCGWWIDNAPSKLAQAIKEMMMMNDGEIAEMGRRAGELVRQKYTWDAVVKTMLKKYTELIRG